MCSLTVIRTGTGCRIVHSRDELRSRSGATRPSWRDLPSGRRALWPTDPDAGGTWVACREDGTVLSLLNRNIPPNGRPEPTRSRGLVIPGAVDAGSIADIRESVVRSDYTGVSPFRLVVTDARGAGWVVTWDGLSMTDPLSVESPICRVSSGLGDHRVEPRRPLFDRLVGANPTPENQDAFHRHRWDDRPEISVLMSRQDARTVSITTIDVRDGHTPAFVVEDLPEGVPWCDPVGASLLK